MSTIKKQQLYPLESGRPCTLCVYGADTKPIKCPKCWEGQGGFKMLSEKKLNEMGLFVEEYQDEKGKTRSRVIQLLMLEEDED